jgi:hypothetical protein
MGQLIDGVWHDTWYDTKSTGGRFSAQCQPFVTGSPPMARLAQRRRRLCGGKRPLSSVCFSRLSVGAPHADARKLKAWNFFRFP